MNRGFLIFNPSAGTRTKSTSSVETVVRQFSRMQIEMVPSPTQAGGNVVSQVQDLIHQTPDLLVVWGGDGTIHEVVNGMFGSNIPVGLLPGGTANLMVRELSIPQNVSAAIRVIAAGKKRSISVGQANDRYFLLMVGIGFDSEVIKNVSWDLKKKFGKLAFGVSALDTARKYQFPKFHIRANGREEEAVFAVICNARHYAAYFVLTPEADISDDFFYVCLFKEPGIASMFRYAVHVVQGRHQKLDSVQVIRVPEVEVNGPEQVAVQADGELIGHLPMKFQIHPRSLKVFCP